MIVPEVGVLVGSLIDQKVMDEACMILEKCGIAYELRETLQDFKRQLAEGLRL